MRSTSRSTGNRGGEPVNGHPPMRVRVGGWPNRRLGFGELHGNGELSVRGSVLKPVAHGVNGAFERYNNRLHKTSRTDNSRL